MNYDNPEDLPIVGYENSHPKLKNEIIKEGQEALNMSQCPYQKDSTFEEWWIKGYFTDPMTN